ncbi:uncharacterized protein PITG_06010 [Phytophthora infestans T30-4]|uniref:Uncharacterized protein n=1 Tax=Phytophthora infestans (strain T30-4) TaxID=403677 RepID=D0N677_PHYIT|nr:uncharacterized protein PITG_06010 [Phytophthora infestans T30-4]EEY70568.1 hypothetical protein PITG_06010 [Phytophthora infestans T30-4]|eukprot:XP_002998222.1 hypothetical protein PITG_06010 [Phytophthora infestans T30-4]
MIDLDCTLTMMMSDVHADIARRFDCVHAEASWSVTPVVTDLWKRILLKSDITSAREKTAMKIWPPTVARREDLVATERRGLVVHDDWVSWDVYRKDYERRALTLLAKKATENIATPKQAATKLQK